MRDPLSGLHRDPPEGALARWARALVALSSPPLLLFEAALNRFSDGLHCFLSLLWTGIGPYRVLTATPASGLSPAVVVTGTSRRTCRHVAVALARMGYFVFAIVSETAHAEELIADSVRLRSQGKFEGTIKPVFSDLSDSKLVEMAAEKIRESLTANRRPLAAVVNGTALVSRQPFETVRREDYEAALAVNLLAPVHLTQLLLPQLKASGGRVINLASVASFSQAPGFGQFCASMAAVAAETFVLRLELRRHGVAVSLVESGPLHLVAYATDAAAAGMNSDGDGPPAGAALDEAGRSPTRKIATALRTLGTQELPPSHVTAHVVHALTSRYPRPRYRVGWDAHFIAPLVTLIGWTAKELLTDMLC